MRKLQYVRYKLYTYILSYKIINNERLRLNFLVLKADNI